MAMFVGVSHLNTPRIHLFISYSTCLYFQRLHFCNFETDQRSITCVILKRLGNSFYVILPFTRSLLTELEPDNASLLFRVGFWIFLSQFLRSTTISKPGDVFKFSIFLVSVISSLRYLRLDHAQLTNNPAPFNIPLAPAFYFSKWPCMHRNQPTNVFDARFGDRRGEKRNFAQRFTRQLHFDSSLRLVGPNRQTVRYRRMIFCV